VVPAGRADLEELAGYADEGRRRAEAGGPEEFELFDPSTGQRFRYQYLWVDFARAPLDFRGLIRLGSGSVRLARDGTGRLRGVSVVIPVNAATLPYLEAQPVTRAYFRGLDPAQRAEYATPEDRTAAWFLRHLHAREPGDAAARCALLRDLFRVAFREGRLLTSSPAPFFQDLLRRSGFVEAPGATHHDFGPDLPSPTYVLDVRGPRLAGFLSRLLEGGGGGRPAAGPGAALPGELASALAKRLSGWVREESAATAAAYGAVPAEPQAEEGPLEALTPRERQVALAVMDGLSNVEIADRLGMRPLTAKKHLTHVFAKAGVASRTQLIRRLLSARGG
jgi:DNA-binding CsgD family transcriptional regulator